MMSGMPPNKELDEEFNARQRRSKLIRDYRIEKALGPVPVRQIFKSQCAKIVSNNISVDLVDFTNDTDNSTCKSRQSSQF